MPDLIITLLNEKIAINKLSARQAAKMIGTSHTTLIRILNGEPYDVPTAQKIAEWLDVPVSTLLDVGATTEDTLAKQIAIALRQQPKLAVVFGEAMARVVKGQMRPESLRALAAYAAYHLQIFTIED